MSSKVKLYDDEPSDASRKGKNGCAALIPLINGLYASSGVRFR